ncbi:MAG: hypothetical protein EAZ57_09665 [Cytophagales bacterium]|nr:MAG: hypothetical protein EAZ67_01305 [Cytophagales bacterium]TAF59905.1 MAG: hypothetical protein EAZ57_09665 [Cytophagales bacterium]
MEKAFLGRGWKFPPTFDKQVESIRMSEEDEDIRESLKILLGTRRGERTMLPEYGCDLHQLVFEDLDSTAINQLRSVITKAVLFFEPRIVLDEVNIRVDNQDVGLLHITLHYTISLTNTRTNMVYPFYLLEGTDIVN